MKASNQKERTSELLKFIGLMVSVFLLSSFILFSNQGIPKSENKKLTKENEELKAQIAQFQLRELELAALAYYADSTFRKLQELKSLETEVTQFKASNPDFEQSVSLRTSLQTRLSSLLSQINGSINKLKEPSIDTSSSVPVSQLVQRVKDSYAIILNNAKTEKEVRLLTALGQLRAATDVEKLALQEELEAQQKLLAQQQAQVEAATIQQSLQGQVQQTQGQLSNVQGQLSTCQTSLSSLRTTMTTLRSQLALNNQALAIESQKTINANSQLSAIINRIRGIGDRKDREDLITLDKDFSSISQQLQEISKNLKAVEAGLNN